MHNTNFSNNEEGHAVPKTNLVKQNDLLYLRFFPHTNSYCPMKTGRERKTRMYLPNQKSYVLALFVFTRQSETALAVYWIAGPRGAVVLSGVPILIHFSAPSQD